MRKYLLFILLVVHSWSENLRAQSALWSSKKDFAKRTWVRKVCTDHNSNTYALSVFEGDYHDPSDKFGFAISKHDSVGSLIWEKVIQDKFAYPRGYDLQCDQLGNLFFIGNTGDSVSVEGQILSGKNGSSFIVKYNSAGLVQWVHQYNAMNYSIALDNSGNCYLTGFLVGPDHFGTFNLNNSYLTGADNGILLVKFLAGGQVQWAKTFGSHLSQGKIVSYANNGTLLLCATFNDDTCQIGNNTLLSSNGSTVMFAVDTTGTVMWAKQFNSMVNITSCATGPNSEVFISGMFSGNVSFDALPLNSSITNVEIFLAEYTSAGNATAAVKFNGPANEACYSMALDEDQNIYLACTMQNAVTYANYTINPAGLQDYFIPVLDSAFNLKTTIRQSPATNGANAVYDLCLLEKSLAFGGCFTNNLYLGQTLYTSGGLPKGFLCRFSLDTAAVNVQTEVFPAFNFEIYPNPSSGSFELFYKCESSGNIQINIYDSKGQLVYKELPSQFIDEYRKKIDLSKQAKGVYFIEVLVNRRKLTKQLILD